MTRPVLTDAEARRIAVDPRHSCIVRAPAGSGKTELLIQRLLALLGQVERPDAILAITFTRKAAAEMRQRVLQALKQAMQPLEEEAAEHARTTYRLATAVLQRNEQQGWHLLEHPGQLQIQTIDSFNAALVRRMPWLSRLGGLPRVSDQPHQLYQQAVRQLVHLRHGSDPLNQAVQQLLSHLDNRADRLEALLIHLLQRRDQWLRHLLNDSARQRTVLEQSLAAVIDEELTAVEQLIPLAWRAELMAVADFAAEHCAQPERPLCRLRGMAQFPVAAVDDLTLWQGLADLLLTGQGQWRKRCDKNCGFPPGKDPHHVAMKQRMKDLLEALADCDSQLLAAVATLPQPRYSAGQWQTLQALVELLPHAVAQLWLVFRQQGEVDFTEIALKARHSLVESGNPTEQLLMLDRHIEHILVDEFQDTSWLQFDLLCTLTSGWQPEEARSLFVVGDPMQSIYRFREAEVGLFLQAARHGIGPVSLQPLQLQANFRSQGGIVDWVNRWFPDIFPRREQAGSGAVSYSLAQPILPELPSAAVEVYARRHADEQAEADQVCRLIEQIRQQQPQQSIAVLVRSRSHLTWILAALKQAGISYQAQDVDVLAQRPVVSDLVALTRAILHAADHLSWLTILRAPWCGLTLSELQLFAATGVQSLLEMVQEQERVVQLSDGAQRRLAGVVQAVTWARQRRGTMRLRPLIEECWQQLQGERCYAQPVGEDAEQVFRLLEQLDYGGDLLSLEQLEQQLSQLFAAADSQADGLLQVMTIHKSKGLEFDHVILPALGRKPRAEDKTLLRWLEHPRHGLLLAPVTAQGDASDPIYSMLGRIEKQKADYEVARLTYVAVTRAKQRLYLLGHADFDQDDQAKPAAGSLLATLWPAVAEAFADLPEEVSSQETKMAPPLLQRLIVEELSRSDDKSLTSSILEAATGLPRFESDTLAREIGTQVHHWLELLARRGVDYWHRLTPAEKEQRIVRGLMLQIGQERRCRQAVEQVIRLVDNVVASERGQWILAQHPQARSEYPLTGVVDQQRVQVIIDRTFVVGGERWVIDYKTATPLDGQSLEEFYVQQREYYRAQLCRYARLLSELDDGLPCRAALYFPACDGWCEIELSE